jgi:hypothetical protein
MSPCFSGICQSRKTSADMPGSSKALRAQLTAGSNVYYSVNMVRFSRPTSIGGPQFSLVCRGNTEAEAAVVKSHFILTVPLSVCQHLSVQFNYKSINFIASLTQQMLNLYHATIRYFHSKYSPWHNGNFIKNHPL